MNNFRLSKAMRRESQLCELRSLGGLRAHLALEGASTSRIHGEESPPRLLRPRRARDLRLGEPARPPRPPAHPPPTLWRVAYRAEELPLAIGYWVADSLRSSWIKRALKLASGDYSGDYYSATTGDYFLGRRLL